MFREDVVRKALGFWKSHPEFKVNMALWLFIEFENGSNMKDGDFLLMVFKGQSIPRRHDYTCDSAGCALGWVAWMFPEEYEKALLEYKSRQHSIVSQTNEFWLLAGNVLGIPESMANYLCHKSDWPSEYQTMSDRDGVIAIFERALKEGSFEFLWRQQ